MPKLQSGFPQFRLCRRAVPAATDFEWNQGDTQLGYVSLRGDTPSQADSETVRAEWCTPRRPRRLRRQIDGCKACNDVAFPHDNPLRTDPCVLVFEDAHTLKAPMLDLIERLGTPARAGRRSALVLALARPELLDARPAWGTTTANAVRVFGRRVAC